MRNFVFIVFMSLLLCCCSYSSRNNSSILSDGQEYSDDTVFYDGDTIVYAGYLKYCDTIAIDSIL